MTRTLVVCSVQFCGPDALLCSLVVTPPRRSTGLGCALVAHAEAHSRPRGVRALYLLTATAEAFFRSCGYVDADRARAPAAIRSSREFADICQARRAPADAAPGQAA